MRTIRYGSIAGATVLLRLAQTEVPETSKDPLISQGSDLAIYVGLLLLAISLTFAIKSLNSKIERVLIGAFGFSVMLIVVLWYF